MSSTVSDISAVNVSAVKAAGAIDVTFSAADLGTSFRQLGCARILGIRYLGTVGGVAQQPVAAPSGGFYYVQSMTANTTAAAGGAPNWAVVVRPTADISALGVTHFQLVYTVETAEASPLIGAC